MNAIPTDASSSARVDGLYRALVGLWAHHERMLWSRVQTLIAVQAAVVGGSYAIGDHNLAATFMSAGAVLGLVVHELVSKDLLDRDVNADIINQLSLLLLPPKLVEQLKREGKSTPFAHMQAEPPRWRPFMRSRYLIRTVIWGFIIFDVTLALLHLLGKAPVLPSTP